MFCPSLADLQGSLSSPAVASFDLAQDLIRDLLRSAWVIQETRRRLYGSWIPEDNRYRASEARASQQRDIIATALRAIGREPDHHVVEPHLAWLRELIGTHPEEVPLAPMFATRLGDWVKAHASPFLGAGAERLGELQEIERRDTPFPGGLPAPSPFTQLEPVGVTAPGAVRFSFAILGDLHIGSPNGEVMVRAAIADINRAGVDLVIQLGDITDHGNHSEFELALDVLGDLEAPVTTMMGNHDVYSIQEAALSGRELYGASFGRAPDGVTFEHKGIRFAILDSVEHGASPFGPFDMISGAFTDGNSGAIVRGSLSFPQHDLLADIAAPGGGPAFVFLHHPPQPFTGFPPILFGLREEDSGRLHAVADSGNIWGVFAGHTHRNARTRTFDGVPVHEVAIPRDVPCGFAIVDVTENGYAFRFQQISDEALLAKTYSGASDIIRKYGTGPDIARGFSWTAASADTPPPTISP